jgi:hypothetical protein
MQYPGFISNSITGIRRISLNRKEAAFSDSFLHRKKSKN